MTTDAVPFMKFDEPRPYVNIMGFAYDAKGEFLIIHRSDKVRSARNVWSFPGGLHECGDSFAGRFQTECHEEFNLSIDPTTFKIIGIYEAVMTGPNEPRWHWVNMICAARLSGFGPLVNREPEKHDRWNIINLDTLYGFYIHNIWSKGTVNALLQFSPQIHEAVKSSK